MSNSPQSTLNARRRINPVAQYLLALAATILGYSAYAIVAVPLLEGPPSESQRPRRQTVVAKPTKRDKSWLRPLVPADGWEWQSCKTVTIDGGTILFRDYQPLEGGYAEVFPLTIIMNAQPLRADGSTAEVSAARTPVIIRCPERVQLKFDRPIAEGMSRGRLELESARLVGQVTIYRPESLLGANDALSLVTRNLQINRTHLFTLEDVKFAYGPHVGHGRHLTMELNRTVEAGGSSVINAGFAEITGIKRIELASLQKLRLEPTSDLLALESRDPSKDHLFSQQRSPLRVSCRGPFAFDLAARVATLNDQVSVDQLGAQKESLRCDGLRLTFAPTQQGGTSSQFQLKSFQAWGSPARVISQSRQTSIAGDQLAYDVATGQFLATARDQVTITNPDFQLMTQKVKYVIPADGSIGPVEAVGPGTLTGTAKEGRPALQIAWQQQLTLQEQDRDTQHVQIEGQANVRLGDETRVQSDRLEFWLTRADNHSAPGGTADSHWQPKRLFAVKDVRLESPGLSGTADTLDATWLPSASDRPQSKLDAQASGPSGLPTRTAIRKTAFRQTIHNSYASPARNLGWQSTGRQNVTTAPSTRIAQAAFEKPAAAVPSAKPLDGKPRLSFSGRTIKASLRQAARRSELMELSIDGDVRVQQVNETGAAGRSASIEGQQLLLTPQPNQMFRVEVLGNDEKRARFRSESLELDGQQIFLDQAANRLWVEGAGKLSMTPAAKTNASLGSVTSAQPPASQTKTRVKKIDVAWVGGMIFDGQKVYFENEVAMNADTQSDDSTGHTTRTRSFSQALSLTLNSPVSFQQLSSKPGQAQPELQHVVLVERVAAEQRVFQLAGGGAATVRLASSKPDARPARTPIVIENLTFDASGKRIEQQTVIAPQATFNAATGVVQATGPGAIQVHRLGKVKAMDKSPGGSTRAAPAKTRLTLTHVKFDGSLIANSQKNEMKIDGRVRSLTSPVASFDEVFDPDREMKTWPLDAVKLVCERAELAQWSPQSSGKASNEMMATGNAHMISSRFEATADRVSYSQANDMLVVEGTPRSDANLWFRQTPAARPNHLVAGKIMYRLSDQWTEVQNVRNVKIKSK